MENQVQKTGEQLRDEGIKRAVDHADAVHQTWSEIAYEFLQKYVVTHDEFMGEDVIAESQGTVPDPPDRRAWGGIMRKAAGRGLIMKAGYADAKLPSSHCKPSTIWRAIR